MRETIGEDIFTVDTVTYHTRTRSSCQRRRNQPLHRRFLPILISHLSAATLPSLSRRYQLPTATMESSQL
jgi:hypothetical protein